MAVVEGTWYTGALSKYSLKTGDGRGGRAVVWACWASAPGERVVEFSFPVWGPGAGVGVGSLS